MRVSLDAREHLPVSYLYMCSISRDAFVSMCNYMKVHMYVYTEVVGKHGVNINEHKNAP